MVRALRGQRPRGVILASSRASGEDAELEGELDALEKLGGGVAAFGGQREPRILIDNFGGARAIGARMAGYGHALGMRVLGWSPNLTAERAAEAGAEFATKEKLLEEADAVSLHIVLSERTRGLLGAAELARMK